MRAILIATLTATGVLLAACSTTPPDEQAPVGVEDRAAGKPGAAQMGAGRASPVREARTIVARPALSTSPRYRCRRPPRTPRRPLRETIPERYSWSRSDPRPR